MPRVFAGMLLASVLAFWHPALAQLPDNVVRIGVLTDMSGPFADQVGRGSVVSAQMAAEDFAPEAQGLKVEVLAADHLNKPDVGVGIARRWVDEDGVAAVVDLPNSGVALAVANLMRQKNRVALASSSATSDLTGKACAPTTIQWVSDTWSQAHSLVHALLEKNLKTWFFLDVDYALGKALERDATEALTAGGGKVLGVVRVPLGTTDFSTPLLQAQSSGAQVLALANTGADAINTIKQAAEFGITRKGMTLAALFLQISDVHSIGLQTAQGLLLPAPFYWDLNEKTRAWSKRWSARMGGRMPTMEQAGVYSATMAYLRAVRETRTLDGAKTVAAMKGKTIDDPLFGPTIIRADGRAVHASYLFRVKSPAESHGPWDYYVRVATILPEKAFRPLHAGGCPMLASR
jgi:branched-chain amino acid transport system substrate-binding protein